LPSGKPPVLARIPFSRDIAVRYSRGHLPIDPDSPWRPLSTVSRNESEGDGPMKQIVFISGKGGTGKTTVARQSATGRHPSDRRLCVDAPNLIL
jgi:MinD superfamily P-loop ATPase